MTFRAQIWSYCLSEELYAITSKVMRRSYEQLVMLLYERREYRKSDLRRTGTKHKATVCDSVICEESPKFSAIAITTVEGVLHSWFCMQLDFVVYRRLSFHMSLLSTLFIFDGMDDFYRPIPIRLTRHQSAANNCTAGALGVRGTRGVICLT